jgi:hypothetical protein
MLSRLLVVAAVLATLALGVGHLALRVQEPEVPPRLSGPEHSGAPELIPPEGCRVDPLGFPRRPADDSEDLETGEHDRDGLAL